MKLLVVDDEELIRNVIKEYSSIEGYEVFEASDGIEAIEIVKNNDIDLIILDIMMPKLDGFRTCEEIKKTKNIPILMLSARSDEYDKLIGFNLGVDDYMTKPFSPKELFARIKAILRRINKVTDEFVYEDLKVDYIGRVVFIENKVIKLTPKEYELLCFFIKNTGVALSRETLLNKIWGYDFFGDDRTVDTHIKMLRNSLGKYRDLIVTVRGMGYKFDVQKY